MDPQVDRVLVEARARSIDVRARIGATAYCESWAVGDSAVMRVPRSEFTNTGPYLTRATALDPRALLDASTDRQRHLPAFVDRLELAGVPVALHARPSGRAVQPGDIPAIARALAAYHEALPYHGHLVPAHIVIGDEIAFTDPLPDVPDLLGGEGYALPLHGDPALRDVAALAAIAAELAGVPLGWTRELAGFLEQVNRGMSRPWDPQPMLAALRARTDDGWINAVGRLVLDHYLPVPSVRPQTTRPREPVPGIARALLVEHDRHRRLGALGHALARSPSLFDFLVHERALPIASQEDRPRAELAYEARDAWFAAIEAAVPALQAIHGAAPITPLEPVLHHPDVAEELRPLRTLALDLDRLLAPVPGTPIGGLLARVTETIARLRDPVVRTAAARRYVNYVSNTSRVYYAHAR